MVSIQAFLSVDTVCRMTKTIPIQEAQKLFGELLSQALAGDEIFIVDGEQTLAKLVSVSPSSKKRIFGLHRGAMKIADDFNAPLPEAFWTATS
jgi:antitoxin (DNA-binding transcriptional repressor) of toxin-antitoxin stability system